MNFYTVSSSLFPCLISLQDKVLFPITRKQKIISAVALAVFASLLLCYAMCCKVLKPAKFEDQKKEEAKQEGAEGQHIKQPEEEKKEPLDEQGLRDSLEEISRKWQEENLGKLFLKPVVIQDEIKYFVEKMVKRMKGIRQMEEEILKKDLLEKIWSKHKEHDREWKDMMKHVREWKDMKKNMPFPKPSKPPRGYIIYVDPIIPQEDTWKTFFQKYLQAFLNFNIPLEPRLRLEGSPQRLLLQAKEHLG